MSEPSSPPVVPPGEERQPNFKEPAPNPVYPGYETLDAGNITGYAAITSTQVDPDTGEVFGIATNAGATKYPWGIERFEDEIEHRTSDENPAHTSVRGRYTLTQELEDRTLVFEQKTLFKSDEKNFNLSITRTVLKDGELFEERSWDETIPRDHQ